MPAIKKTDEENNTIVYARINGTSLTEKKILDEFSAKEIFLIRDKVPKIKGILKEGVLTQLLPDKYINGSLVHGDMKIDNIIVAQNNEIYLIDFEFGNYIFREFDDAYMLLSILQVDSLKANEYLKLVAKDGVSKAKIIFGELYFINGVLMNPRINVEVKRRWVKIESYILKELQEINSDQSQ
ncbi:MAG: phosphotransferase [Candidatus Micrarchaeia archaeon]